MVSVILIGIIVLGAIAWFAGSARAKSLASGNFSKLHSRPGYHGVFLAIWTTVPALILLCIWPFASGRYLNSAVADKFSQALSSLSLPQTEAFMRDVRAIAQGGIVSFPTPQKEQAAQFYTSLLNASNWLMLAIVSALVLVGAIWAWRKISLQWRARNRVEKFISIALIICSAVAILTTIGIVLSLIFETIRFFQKVPFFDFVLGTTWSPQSAFESANKQVDPEELGRIFGAIPLFAGTLLITLIAILVAAPIGLMSAIYLSEYASNRFRAIAKPLLEILAGVPTVVYGFFAALTIAPMIRGWGEAIGLSVASESALAAGLVMGIMIIPFVSSLSDDVINAVPQSLRDGSYGLGATQAETIQRVVMPAALPGIVSAILLAISRAIGETMIVVMAAGLAANLTANPLEAVTTVTVQIVTLLVGDQEFDSAKTLAAFALGLILFCITLALNIIALRVVTKYREQYD